MRTGFMKNKILAALIATCLVLSLPPASASAAGDVCSIGGNGYSTLGEAITAALNAGGSQTIELLQSITEASPVIIDGANITFDLNGHDLTIDTSGAGGSTALTVSGGSVGYEDGGFFNVIGSDAVRVYGANASATVTSATATADEGTAVRVSGQGASVTVNGSASATHPNRGYGVYAESGSSATVTGNVTAAMFGVVARSGSTVVIGSHVSTTAPYSLAVSSANGSSVEVGGNVTAAGIYCVGADAGSGGKITIDGILTSAATYIRLDTEYIKNAGDYDEATTKPGYLTYSNEVSTDVITTVWVAVDGGTADPAVATNPAQNITGTGAALYGSVQYQGEQNLSGRGFAWATHTMPTVNDNMLANVTGDTDDFTGTLTGLSPGTAYYVRAYAIYGDEDLYYGNEISFTTPAGGTPGPGPVDNALPTVVTNAVSGVTASGAALSGNVISAGSTAVTERGFVYGKSGNPSLSTGIKVAGGSGTGSFTANVSNLEPNTTYYVCAYANNSRGTAYGAVISFKTAAVGVPNTGGNSTPWISWLLLSAAMTLAGITVIGRKTQAKQR